ncbi:MAG: hypothetical protein D9V47_10130 [Clostridia bacterium]|nr:MAG: hypothetical protein D9V47_10130 [Clostridia bacterium]
MFDALEAYDRLLQENRVVEALEILYQEAGADKVTDDDWRVALARFRTVYGRPPLFPGEQDGGE